jgi:hypothetical protein
VAIALVNLIITFSGLTDTALVVAGSVFIALLDALYLWLAVMIRKGASGARTWVTVLFVVGIVSWLADLGGSATALVKAISVIQLLIMTAILALLWQRPSNAYFGARRRETVSRPS